jgi:hypothetical protein
VDVHFVRHNQGRKWRNLNFNRDCWLTLLGFPLDYWNHECIQNAIAPFGKVLLWENDKEHLARLMVKARVTNLQDVPHYIVFSDTQGFYGESWTRQCEIVEHEMLHLITTDEDMVPPPDNGQPPPYDFFGLGQMGQAPGNQFH